jgi:hypothetical protein
MNFHKFSFVLSIASLSLLPSCISLGVVPLYDTIKVDSSIGKAEGELIVDGKVVKKFPVPGKLRIRKKGNVVLRFKKEGYRTQSVMPGVTTHWGWYTLSMIVSVPTIFIGGLYDLDSGASLKYTPRKINLELEPLEN